MAKEFIFYVKNRPVDENKYSDPNTIYKEFIDLARIDQEVIWLLGLNNAHKAIINDCIFKGTFNNSTCDPKLIFKRLLQAGCAAFIIIHNHPAGGCNPSTEDNIVTAKIAMIAKIIGISFLDHIIIADDTFFSYSREGLLPKLPDSMLNDAKDNFIKKLQKTRLDYESTHRILNEWIRQFKRHVTTENSLSQISILESLEKLNAKFLEAGLKIITKQGGGSK